MKVKSIILSALFLARLAFAQENSSNPDSFVRENPNKEELLKKNDIVVSGEDLIIEKEAISEHNIVLKEVETDNEVKIESEEIQKSPVILGIDYFLIKLTLATKAVLGIVGGGSIAALLGLGGYYLYKKPTRASPLKKDEKLFREYVVTQIKELHKKCGLRTEEDAFNHEVSLVINCFNNEEIYKENLLHKDCLNKSECPCLSNRLKHSRSVTCYLSFHYREFNDMISSLKEPDINNVAATKIAIIITLYEAMVSYKEAWRNLRYTNKPSLEEAKRLQFKIIAAAVKKIPNLKEEDLSKVLCVLLCSTLSSFYLKRKTLRLGVSQITLKEPHKLDPFCAALEPLAKSIGLFFKREDNSIEVGLKKFFLRLDPLKQ